MTEKNRFTIGGIEFSLSKEEVERKLKEVEPENVREVYVEVNGKRYPIKQALAATAGLLRGGFTTHDAMRVFRKLSLSVGTEIGPEKQNVSELLFEDYLDEYKLGVPDREPTIPGKRRRIDYRLSFESQVLWFEVKEFAEDASLLNGFHGAYDPYLGIRRKIDKASEKFREYEGECCSLVLYNRTINLNDICTPSHVLGAMLGNVSFRIPIDFERGIETGPASRFFAGGGKLIHPHTKDPQKTRISAVIALEQLAVGQKEFRIALAKEEQGENRHFSWEEVFEFLKSQQDAYAQTALRVLVYENPYAKRRLPANIFTGPFDVRWGPVDGQPYIDRLYVGPELKKLEDEERELGVNLGPLQKAKLQPWEDGYQSRRRRATKAPPETP